jgi:hypothetical protein
VGSINPAMQHLDFYVRSLERDSANQPDREVFDHFFPMGVRGNDGRVQASDSAPELVAMVWPSLEAGSSV